MSISKTSQKARDDNNWKFHHCDFKKMMFVSEERLKKYPRKIRIILLTCAIFGLFILLYLTFWNEFYLVLFTDDPKEPSDYAGFVLALCIIIVIINTFYRIFKLSSRELERKFK